ncbi:ankyrin repeat domain-containing protein SOWAHC, partial [Atheta coriaria]|uniref:ankyrin repeat domain-containing protein SOWAHC n=1 Tax=Dalotia coriaria TaxID=877792 RepID=UPI0031F3A98D
CVFYNKYNGFRQYTVLHWGAKHGNADIIKLFAGTYSADVNAKTNGGYTPLHLAAHFGRTDVYKLLIEVYKADDSIRDYRGKRAVQLREANNQVRNKITAKTKSRKNKYGDKFLRVGSLNVRVKKTTEAFSSFLGVGGGGGSLSTIEPISEKVHKGWGSADNVAQESVMPAPKGYITKLKPRRPADAVRTHSNPETPNQPPKFIQRHPMQDSDSDSAAGFDSSWQN